MVSYIITQDELNSDGVSRSTKNNYTLYKYKLPVSVELNKLRSVISIDSENGQKIVCFSPPKSISYSEFCDLHSAKDIVSEEFVEGTMVNVFWDGSEWKQSTKSKLDADCFFFDTNGSFYRMFADAILSAKLDLSTLNKSYCYSFVMQHPENRLVTLFTEIKLYLISAYHIERINDTDTKITVVDNVQTDPVWSSTYVKFPARLNWDLKTHIEGMPYTMMGVSFKDTETGDRCKLRNLAYEYVRHLRGNQPKLRYRYLELRKMDNVVEFLKFYPEHSAQFRQYQTNLHTYTSELFKHYVNIYIKKSYLIDTIDSKYHIGLKRLHSHYKEVLLPQKKYVTLQATIEYVNRLPEAVLMSVIR